VTSLNHSLLYHTGPSETPRGDGAMPDVLWVRRAPLPARILERTGERGRRELGKAQRGAGSCFLEEGWSEGYLRISEEQQRESHRAGLAAAAGEEGNRGVSEVEMAPPGIQVLSQWLGHGVAGGDGKGAAHSTPRHSGSRSPGEDKKQKFATAAVRAERKTPRQRKRSARPMSHGLFLPLAPFSCQFPLPGNSWHPPLGLAVPASPRWHAFPPPLLLPYHLALFLTRRSSAACC